MRSEHSILKVMTPQEKLQKIKEAQQKFHASVQELRKQYLAEIQKINKGIEERKLANVRRELGMTT
jgi:hypothetical protein